MQTDTKSAVKTTIKTVCIIIPTYNEAENVKVLLPLVLRTKIPAELHVLVVDDSSPDGTAAEVRRLQRIFPRLHLLLQEKKQGHGAAYIAGFRHALNTLYPDVLFEMDADFSHNPEDIPRLFAALADADVVIGSRYVSGGKTVGWNLWRKLVSFCGNTLGRTIVGLPVKDCTAGFRAWRRETIRSIDFSQLRARGYAFQVSILHAAHSLGAKIKEIPVTFTERRQGKSKMQLRDMIEFLGVCVRLGLKTVKKSL